MGLLPVPKNTVHHNHYYLFTSLIKNHQNLLFFFLHAVTSGFQRKNQNMFNIWLQTELLQGCPHSLLGWVYPSVKQSDEESCLMDRMHSWNRGKHLFPNSGLIWRYVLLI
ncbi:Periplasmic [NiFeSe] hydrogenase small subunit [Frankliniella fusca]|uniref:Periplasmic [NiFeSe] hydrogenase small subunit n=1 Tax=Frankliniella fusca TaxID=407009 RepID=A0AAE1HXB6_9NEOP|nr:Periplasmic [NiFeSe] hydrogenase small subunit [Frankliniella fusca]